jgi:MSHA biogenesis protein MshN
LNAAKGSARGNAEYNALLGTVLQRLAKHREAADAYREALRLAPDAGPAWVGLAMSLEALEHRPEAAEAFRRAMATGSLSTDLRVFAEQRAHSLQR